MKELTDYHNLIHIWADENTELSNLISKVDFYVYTSGGSASPLDLKTQEIKDLNKDINKKIKRLNITGALYKENQ